MVPATCCHLPSSALILEMLTLRYVTPGQVFMSSCFSGCVLGERPDNSSVVCQLVVGADCRSRENLDSDVRCVVLQCGFHCLFTCQILAFWGTTAASYNYTITKVLFVVHFALQSTSGELNSWTQGTFMSAWSEVLGRYQMGAVWNQRKNKSRPEENLRNQRKRSGTCNN